MKANKSTWSVKHLVKIYKTIRRNAKDGCSIRNKKKTEGDERNKNHKRNSGRKKEEKRFSRRTNEEIYNIYREPKIDEIIISRTLQRLGQLERMPENRIMEQIPWTVKREVYQRQKVIIT